MSQQVAPHATHSPAIRSGEPTKAAGRGAFPRPRSAGRALVLALALSTPLSGCYRYVPVETVEPGVRVALELNDQGRAALSDSIGQAVRVVEGTVHSANGEAYDLRVNMIRQFSGQSYAWSGEPLRVPRVFVGQTRERRLDRGRSWALAIGAAALLATVIISTDLFAGSQPLADVPPPPPEGPQ